MKKVVLIGIVALTAFALQTVAQEKKEKQVDRKVEVVKNNDEIKVKVIENGATIIEKTYASAEELKNDPEIKDYNIMIGGGESGHKTMIFKDKDGNVSKMDGNAGFVWVSDDGEYGDATMEFDSEDGQHINIRKDANGEMIIERNGEVVEMGDMKSTKQIKVKKLDDGTIQIEDENGTRTVSAGEMKGGAMFITKDGSGEGTQVFEFKSDDHEGDMVIDLKGDNTWVSDSLHDSDHNVMFFGTSENMTIDSDGETQHVIIRKESADGENGELVEVIIQKLHIKISDLHDIKEVEVIPGSNVVSDNLLELDEVNYYPNPNTGVFNLKFSAQKQPTQIRVIDMMGKEVYTEDLKSFQGMYDNSIDLSSNNKGVYVLQILQGEKTWNKKLVIE